MPTPGADKVVTQKHIRFFYQPEGPGPDNKIHYAGLDGEYIVIEDQTNPKSGGVTRINVHDLYTPGGYTAVGKSVDAPDLPTATVQFMQMHGAVPGHLIGYDCPMNFYQVVGSCKDLSDLLDGATDYWKVFSMGEHTSSSEKGGAFDADDALQDGLDFTFDYIAPHGALSFGEEGASVITLEIVDGVYGSKLNCGDCGAVDDGTMLWYGVQINDSGTSAPPVVIYTTDGFETMASATITGAAATDEPVAIEIVGRYLVVVFNGSSDAGYFAAPINEITGVPGTFTKITTGFVSSHDPNDIWVANPREVYFAANGGYIYKSESILQGVDPIHTGDVTTANLLRITEQNGIILAGGVGGALVVSYNRGASFSAPTVAATASDIQAVAIWNDYTFWVGDSSGGIYYTDKRGEVSWSALSTGLTLSAVDDIVWINHEYGYISAQTAGSNAVLLSTFTGGRLWSTSDPLSGRFVNYPTFDRGNRISYPRVSNVGIATNHVVVAGLHGDGTDGIVVYGKADITP